MPPDIQIRRFRRSNLRRIIEIERSAFPGAKAYSRGMFLELSDRCGDLFLVAKHSERIIGYMVTCVKAQNAEIVSIAVDSKHRNRGVGKALMLRTLAILKASGVGRAVLTVRPTNRPGIHFYRRLGFTHVGRIAQYYEGSDAFKMQKIL
jgi:ribosomal-protein-alanine N-acetyltransferase